MNLSKKHKRHIAYKQNLDDLSFFRHCCGKKHRKAIIALRKDVKNGSWQERVYKSTGIAIKRWSK